MKLLFDANEVITLAGSFLKELRRTKILDFFEFESFEW